MNKAQPVVLALTAMLTSYHIADAKGWGQTTIEDGGGEAIVVKRGLFGNKSTFAQDRLGDKYMNKHGLFGTKDQGVSVLGSSFEKKRGLLGGSDIEGSTILGDRIQSKKSLFTLGRRTTNVDLSGTSKLVGQIFSQMKAKPPLPQPVHGQPTLANPEAFPSTSDNSALYSGVQPGPGVQPASGAQPGLGAQPGPFQ